ncbi:hypothetical protein ACKU27_01805 [Sphingobium yanoikuyae]|jgi:hypothetical protein|uniref:hypothetical protein n=1 Tax=Sphingobium yanoikuyae TaxID=13690 RepID=UPI002FDEEB43
MTTKNMPFPVQAHAPTLRPGLVLWACLLLFMVTASLSALRVDVTQGFDELAHLSYAAEIQGANGAAVPLERLRLLDPATMQWTDNDNYLNHPAPYYQLMAAMAPRLIGAGAGAVIILHFVNVAIVGIGLLLMLGFGRGLVRTDAEWIALGLNLCCIRLLIELAGAVNNDNLAFLGGGALLFGLGRYLRRGALGDLLLACIGLIVASLAKLTGLMLCGGTLAALLMLLVWTGKRMPLLHLGLVLLASAVAAWPFVAFWLAYGSPAPDTFAQQSLLRDGAAAAGWAGQARMAFPAYVLMFLTSFVEGWMPVLSERTGLQWGALAIPACMLILAMDGIRRAGVAVLVQRRRDSLAMLILAGGAAAAGVMLVHILFSYQRHLATGWMMDAYPRYYLPLLPIVPLAALYAIRSLPDARHRRLARGLMAGAPLLFALIG